LGIVVDGGGGRREARVRIRRRVWAFLESIVYECGIF
jgi:hypothetical protein